jgi:carbonic anhydrase
MRKLIAGIMEFRRLRRADYQDTFAELALGQRPDVLFIACSDSRVAVNVFASTDPGDMFVVRNVGNLIPPSDVDGRSTSDESEASAIEFALSRLEVSHVVVCGHSDCGAIKALCAGRGTIPEPNLRAWLRHAEPALAEARKKGTDDVRTVSQLNVLQQLEHIGGYPLVKSRVDRGELQLHGLWFDIRGADVYYFEPLRGKFVLIDDMEGASVLERLGA